MGRNAVTTVAAVALLLCSAVAVSGRRLQQDTPPGGDRDANGCIPSTGYSWCESLGECVRPWETECPVDTPANMPGSDRDANGCIPSAGYSWCESLGECTRPWEKECPVSTPATAGDNSTTSNDNNKCPAHNEEGMTGGWSPAEANSANVEAAAEYVIQYLGLPANTTYTVEVACTQVVAGTNYFMVVDLASGGGFTATVYQALPSAGGAYDITELHYKKN